MRIISWNVNGLRSIATKGFKKFLAKSGADVVAVQESRATHEQIPEEIREVAGWHVHVTPAKRPGYSGVAIWSRRKPDDVTHGLGLKRFDVEGRLQLVRFGDLVIANGYFPNGNGKERDLSRIPYKLAFYRAVFRALEADRAAGRPILVMGDFNTAHQEIDLARPTDNVKNSGFTPIERKELDRWLKNGWTDTFRHFEKGPGHYSWWSQRFGVRAKNIGWRLDLITASPGAMPHLQGAFIMKDVKGSDHCPVGVDVDDRIIGPALLRRRG